MFLLLQFYEKHEDEKIGRRGVKEDKQHCMMNAN